MIADDLTPEQVKAYRIADNKVSDFSVWDNKKLLEELQDLDELAGDLFTGFDTSDFFDDTLDESDNSVISNNESGVIYEAVFKSESAEKIDRIREAWEKMDNE